MSMTPAIHSETLDSDKGASGIYLVVVVPCHNEEMSIPLFLKEMDDVLRACRDEGLLERSTYIFVDDGSSDGTLGILRQAAANRLDICYSSLSRNFGKEGALLCGMNRALDLKATHVAVMDVDLQDPPTLLPQLLKTIDSDSRPDIVATYRRTRTGEPALRSWFARRFYALENRICDVEMKDGARDFRIMTARVVREICNLPERERFSKGLFQWVGFKTEWVGYDNAERVAGETSWSSTALFRYAFDGIVSFSNVPLEWISVTGLLISLVSLIGLVVVFVRALLFGDPVSGWPSLVCIVLLLGGLQLSALGIIGLYLAKVLSETKRRPKYIETERENGSSWEE